MAISPSVLPTGSESSLRARHRLAVQLPIYVDHRPMLAVMKTIELREPTFFVLAALADGPKHGYAISREAASLSAGRVQLKTGTLYAALDRLDDQKLISASGEEVVDGRLRRYYRLTDAGAEVLAAEVERMRTNAAQVTARLRSRSLRPETAQ